MKCQLAILVGVAFVATACIEDASESHPVGTDPAFSIEESRQGWTLLLDEELSLFDRYLSYAFEPDYSGSQPLDEHGKPIAPIGLNPNGYDVFDVLMESGTPVLRVSGEYYGSVTTKQNYRNYHFQVAFRWGEEVHDPRKGLLKDSGILYHAIGAHGDEYWRSWKMSQEFQIMEGHLGDYWSVGSSAIDVRSYPREFIMSPIASLHRPFLEVGTNQPEKGYVMRRENHEITDEWNRLELVTYEGKSLHIVNGEIVMVLANSRYFSGDEEDKVAKPLLEGQIQIQSEGAEIFFKDMRIRNLDSLPGEYASLFEKPM